MDDNKVIYFSKDINEIVIVVGNHKFRIYENLIKHFVDGTRLIEKVEINKEKFYEFANYAVSITNEWNNFATISISPDAQWSVVIKTNNNGTKRYAGTQSCPNNWQGFCKCFDEFFYNKPIEKSNELNDQNSNLSFENIISVEYNKNGFNDMVVNEITKFVISTIEDFEQDRFWSDSARTFLGLLILVNLNSEKKINIKNMLYQIADINSVRNIIINNIEELKKYSILQVFTNNENIIQSDKTLQSILKLIENGLIKYYAQNNQEGINDEPYIMTQKIIIPQNISEISQETLANIYLYKMNEDEKEKIKLLNIDENKYERSMEFIKYINGIGYVVVDYINAIVNNNGIRGGQNIYRLIVAPELDINKAKRNIYKFLEECFQ